MPSSQPNRIGIIADSHGKVDMIKKAVIFLQDSHCDKIIHLGDICDSFSPATCDSCLKVLMDNNVIALKGNNDHVLEVNQTGNNDTVMSTDGLAYLQQLAPVIECGDAVFAHSLPFYNELGISCITRFMGEAEIRLFFSKTGYRILFRGHGHDPEIVWKEKERVHCTSLETGSDTDLTPYQPCIITCGALTRGLSMIWDKRGNILKNRSFL